MLEPLSRFTGLFCTGLAAGIAVCVLLMGRGWSGTPQFYTELMQLLSRTLTVPAPALGAFGMIAIALNSALLFQRGAGAAFWLAVASALCALAAGVLTKFGHFPINNQVVNWNPANPPGDWTNVQARWSALHLARTIAALGSFGLFLLSSSLPG
ncbi:MAG: DUF1772 domain-containing protein [Pseudomonadota bacterium]